MVLMLLADHHVPVAIAVVAASSKCAIIVCVVASCMWEQK